jgi:hypothetical protein
MLLPLAIALFFLAALKVENPLLSKMYIFNKPTVLFSTGICMNIFLF